MRIKTQDGEVNVTSQGQGTLNTVLGAVGTLGALTVGGGILGLGRGQRQQDSDDRPVTRYEMSLWQQINEEKVKNALLESKGYTDKIAAEQAAYNGANTAIVRCMQGQIADLLSITRRVIPNGSVSPGWGAVVVEPFFAPASVTGSQQSGSGTSNQNASQQG